MYTISSIANLRETIKEWRKKGESIAFIPTMGNLHDGHISLVEHALGRTDHTVVSVFVNPLQFGEGEDYQGYPRTLNADREQLAIREVDILFVPNLNEMYPEGMENHAQVVLPENLTNILCGVSRPTHFAGVTTVVAKLFNIIQPDMAIFGEKDYQQLFLIKKMVQDLCMPIEVVGKPIIREKNKLAMSSRNQYLTAAQREVAPNLFATLNNMRQRIQDGERDFDKLTDQAQTTLSELGFKPDYISIRNRDTLAVATDTDKNLIILAAAYLGKARLLDNIKCSIDA